jgi:hypothetical protein
MTLARGRKHHLLMHASHRGHVAEDDGARVHDVLRLVHREHGSRFGRVRQHEGFSALQKHIVSSTASDTR